MSRVNREMLINVSSSETRIAIVEDKALVEFYVERPENERMVGDIYKGKVENVVNAFQAAFVNIGKEQNGFLPFSDVGHHIYQFTGIEEMPPARKSKKSKPRYKQQSTPRLKTGQTILVQVTKEPIGNKGARLTMDLSLPGRFLVLVPYDQSIGVSRKIDDQKERNRLRRLARSLQPDGFGLIIRTVALGKDLQTLQSDLENLLKIWKRIEDKSKGEPEFGLLYKDSGMTSAVIRDLFNPDVDRLIVDSRKLYGEIRKYLKEVSPSLIPRLKLYQEKMPIFDQHFIENQIEKSFSRKIWIKGGGYLVFDQTEAMMVVDVNSGRSIEQKDHELNAFRVNLEAAREVTRQFRLRDIGGIIVIDFIDMTLEKNRKKLVAELCKELKKDRAAFDIQPMNGFGLVSLTRERLGPSLLFRSSEPCPRCNGLGRVPSKSSIITQLERSIQQYKMKTGERRLILAVHPDMLQFLKAGITNRLRRLMFKFFVYIKLVGDTNLNEDEFIIRPFQSNK